MLDKVRNDLPELVLVSSEPDYEGSQIVKDSFMWEDFEVFVTRRCKVTEDTPETFDNPAYYEYDEGVITEINLEVYDGDAPYNLLFASQEIDFPTILEKMFPFSEIETGCEVFFNGK